MTHKDNILVADRSKQRVRVFDEKGNHIKDFGSAILARGVCMDGEGRILVVESGNHRISIFLNFSLLLRKLLCSVLLLFSFNQQVTSFCCCLLELLLFLICSHRFCILLVVCVALVLFFSASLATLSRSSACESRASPMTFDCSRSSAT